MTQDAYFSLITHTKQLLFVTFCDTTAENGAFFGHTDTQTNGRKDGQKDVEVEIIKFKKISILKKIEEK